VPDRDAPWGPRRAREAGEGASVGYYFFNCGKNLLIIVEHQKLTRWSGIGGMAAISKLDIYSVFELLRRRTGYALSILQPLINGPCIAWNHIVPPRSDSPAFPDLDYEHPFSRLRKVLVDMQLSPIQRKSRSNLLHRHLRNAVSDHSQAGLKLGRLCLSLISASTILLMTFAAS
jgi:hypothetical protein